MKGDHPIKEFHTGCLWAPTHLCVPLTEKKENVLGEGGILWYFSIEVNKIIGGKKDCHLG